jgi:hypothetical protein
MLKGRSQASPARTELWCYAGIRGRVSFFDPFSCSTDFAQMNEATERLPHQG